MSIDPEISQRVYAAFNSADVAEFENLLKEYPVFLRHSDGTDRWMWQAATEGNLPLIKCLVRLGQNVNESKDIADFDDPFCQVEGAILQAAGGGHLDIVRWLLDNGAKINYSINGKSRCLPLLNAAAKGHSDVVKLLVENGADLNFRFNGHTPLSQAINYGHHEIAEYLKSAGAV